MNFNIIFAEEKSNKYLGKIAGLLLEMEAIREVRKSEDNTTLTCIVTENDAVAVNYDMVELAVSNASHTIHII